MSTYRVKEKFEWKGEAHEAGKELELTEEEAAGIGTSYLEPVGNGSEQPPTPPSNEGEGGRGQSETDGAAAGGDASGSDA